MGIEPERGLAEIMRDEMVMRDRITACLRDEPKTIPEIAEALEFPRHEVLLWVMAMWRYGMVAEVEKPRGEEYFRYSLKRDRS
jgi:hypothetical protein